MSELYVWKMEGNFGENVTWVNICSFLVRVLHITKMQMNRKEISPVCVGLHTDVQQQKPQLLRLRVAKI